MNLNFVFTDIAACCSNKTAIRNNHLYLVKKCSAERYKKTKKTHAEFVSGYEDSIGSWCDTGTQRYKITKVAVSRYRCNCDCDVIILVQQTVPCENTACAIVCMLLFSNKNV